MGIQVRRILPNCFMFEKRDTFHPFLLESSGREPLAGSNA
jgi:hypothetical protein